ncbi:tail fiber domain-containing protein [Croceiramulus getboli]|nr:tail fiber domain-containing protein [Flavobacteriaceae bacterium YJPT1-3]
MAKLLRVFLGIFFLSQLLHAQVGIGTTNPSSSSILDVFSESGNKGMLIPRVNITNLNSQDPIKGNIEESLLVYNTNTTTGKGFYYWNNNQWNALAAGGGGADTSIYANDGSINTNRFVDLNGNSLILSDGNGVVVDNSRMYPLADATDNVDPNGYYLGEFTRHYSRVYTRGIHVNDTDATRGLDLRIGGSQDDYTFSDTALFPATTSGVKDLGKSNRRWDVVYARSVSTTSDRRLKENIEQLKKGLNVIQRLNTYSYTFKADPKKRAHIGFMAQELQQELPEVVTEGEDADKTLGVNYAELLPVLVNAIQEQQEQIKNLQQEMAELKAEQAAVK